MRNDTSSEIIIKMRNIDNAVRFTERLRAFCDIASSGGDVELFIKQNGKMKSCGFVAHDLSVRSVEHIWWRAATEDTLGDWWIRIKIVRYFIRRQLCRIGG